MAFVSADRKNVSRFVALLVATFAGLALAASTAAAATVQATCSDFGTTLAAATSNETIQLTGLCSSSNGGATFFLPSGVSGLTIEGAPSGTNGVDGTGVTSPALTSPIGGIDGLTLSGLTSRTTRTPRRSGSARRHGGAAVHFFQ